MLGFHKNPHATGLSVLSSMAVGSAAIFSKTPSDSAQFGYQRTISDNNPRQIPESNESLESIWR
jgi:hypothetical protein